MENALEDVPLLDLPGVDLVEELHEHKRGEHQRGMLRRLAERVGLEAVHNVEELRAAKDQNKQDNELVDRVADHIAQEGARDQWLVLAERLLFQDIR